MASTSLAQNMGVTHSNMLDMVLSPYTYLENSGSKNLSRKTGQFFNQWLKVEEKYVTAVGDISNMLHQSSLLVDDIQDDSDLRRGVTAAHLIYGDPLTMNASAYKMLKATQLVHTVFRDKELLHRFCKYMKFLHISQGMDLYYRDYQCQDNEDFEEDKIPTEKDYNDILVHKTAGQLMLMATLLGSKSTTEVDIIPLAQLIGHHFQIRDDYLNLMSKQYEEKKGFCEDLTEGKFSLPVIRTLHSDHKREAGRLYQIIRMHTKDKGVLQEALDILKATGAICYTENRMREFRSAVMKELIVLGSEMDITKLMEIIGINM